MKKDPEKSIISFNLKAEIEHSIHANNLNLCLECGKCSAVCPMLDFYGEYVYDHSPRGIVERLSLDPEMIDNEAFWYCLTCQECTFFCPSGVNFQNFMIELRELLLLRGHKKYAIFCPDCGGYLMPEKEFKYLQKDNNSDKISELLSVCPRCKKKKYVETLYRVAPLSKKL